MILFKHLRSYVVPDLTIKVKNQYATKSTRIPITATTQTKKTVKTNGTKKT